MADSGETKGRRAADAAFEQFWARYPRKRGKLAAKRKWDAARVTPELLETIMRALDWQIAEWAKGDARFIPHPGTWLSQGRYLDQPDERPTQATASGDPWWWADCPHDKKCPSFQECAARIAGTYREDA